jgi:hypothetical protein
MLLVRLALPACTARPAKFRAARKLRDDGGRRATTARRAPASEERGRRTKLPDALAGDQHQRPVRHLPLGLGLLDLAGLHVNRHRILTIRGSTFHADPHFNGDIALIACFASAWTPAMVRRWHADPFGFLRPWNEVPALFGSAPPAAPPSTGTGVVVCIMG